jgi:diguanylate cyclase (GGDEF)-like protein
MSFRSLRHRIVAVFVGLLVVIMAMVLVLVNRSGEQIINGVVDRQLQAGAKTFGSLLNQNNAQLEIAAKLLSSDFGFREAIATGDKPTILSVLRNHGSRIKAQIMLLVSLDGQIMADTRNPAAVPYPFPFPDLLAGAQSAMRISGISTLSGNKPYQLVVVPVLAPTRLAWIVMGFQVDNAWAREFSALSGLEVSIVQRDDAGASVLATSLSGESANAVTAAVDQLRPGQPRPLALAGSRYQSLAVPLEKNILAVLQRPIDQDAAPFRTLQTVLWGILAGGVLFFILGSVLLARRIAQPINRLAVAAERVEAGNYSEAVAVTSRDEIGQLASSFVRMREGIASRERKILRLAYQDILTGLNNRTRFLEALDELRGGEYAAIALLDLDRFRLINNALGHSVGDHLLVEVGRRLDAMPRGPGLLARLGEDEFAFLLPAFDARAARDFAESILTTLREPVEVDGQRLDVSASVGIALFPQDGANAITLLRRAELAVYTAKKHHSGIFLAADVAEEESAPEQLSLIGEMREALARDEFFIHYQPKLDFHSGTIASVEALIRWRHPVRGLIPPCSFIPFAEKTGFIREITPWVLEQAVAQAARWREAGRKLVPCVNISTHDLLNPGLVELVRQLVARHQLAPKTLCLEITESALMEDPETALVHLGQLAELGVRLSVDDYGAGQASLAYVKTLPVHELKIDRMFVRALASSSKDAAIVQSTVALGHALGLAVVAEGVETEADFDWLRATDCDIVQGYWLARPMPVDEFETWLDAWQLPETRKQALTHSD